VQEQVQEGPYNTTLIEKEKEARERYIQILNSSLALIRQQSKVQWLIYGD